MSLFRAIQTGIVCRFRDVALITSLVLTVWFVSLCAPHARAEGVYDLGDVNFGLWSPFVKRWSQQSPVCITSNSNSGIFKILVTGLTPGQTFALSNDINTRVDYRLFWHTGSKYQQREVLQSGVVSRKVYTYSMAPACSDGPTGMLRVLLDQKKLEAAVPAVYSDTLLLMVVAQ